jgi:hypothetical protein
MGGWGNGFAPFGQDGIPPTAGKAAKFRMLWIEWKVAYKKGIEAFNLLFNLPTLNKQKAVMVCIRPFKLQAMTALIKSFCGGVQMFHGGSFFKKRPPWPPEALTSVALDYNVNSI